MRVLSREMRIKIVNAQGDPVPGALVTIDESSVVVPEIALLSDSRGELLLRLPDGSYRLKVRAPDGSLGDLQLTVAEAGQVARVMVEPVR